MVGDGMWWWVAVLAVVAVVAVAAWLKMRQKPAARDAAPREPVAEPIAPDAPAAPTGSTARAPERSEPVLSPPVVKPIVKTVEPPRMDTPPRPPVEHRAAPPAAPAAPSIPAAPVAPRVAAATPVVVDRPPLRPSLPRVPRFELRDAQPEPVLVVERARAGAWDDARELASTPVQRELLGGALLQAAQLDGAADGPSPCFAVHVRAATALAVARGEIAAGALTSVPTQAIHPVAAADFAAALLALHAARGPMPELRAQVGQTKTVGSTLHPKLVAQTEGRAKSLVQDLGRYLREAEENYAGAIRKPVFIERIGHACQQAAALWQGAQAAAAAARTTLQQQSAAPRFGEVQLERSVAALRELQGQRRVLDLAARLISGWEQLRLLLGRHDPAAGRTLQDTAGALAHGLADERALLASLARCIENAKAPDYVGKAEFNANRHAAQELLVALDADAMLGAAEALAQAGAKLQAEAADAPALALLLQLDGEGHVVAVREPAASTA